MRRRTAETLELGPDVVQLLLPHRPPLLLVDRVLTFTLDPDPALTARRQISANEPVFAGHFPQLKLWPGVYTIEGLGQSCNLLNVIKGMVQRTAASGGDPVQALAALRNLELGYRMQPRYRPELTEQLLQTMPPPGRLLGLSTSVEMKLHSPVFAGECLDYSVRQTHLVDRMVRWEVEATVESRVVASGVLSAQVDAGLLLPAVG